MTKHSNLQRSIHQKVWEHVRHLATTWDFGRIRRNMFQW